MMVHTCACVCMRMHRLVFSPRVFAQRARAARTRQSCMCVWYVCVCHVQYSACICCWCSPPVSACVTVLDSCVCVCVCVGTLMNGSAVLDAGNGGEMAQRFGATQHTNVHAPAAAHHSTRTSYHITLSTALPHNHLQRCVVKLSSIMQAVTHTHTCASQRWVHMLSSHHASCDLSSHRRYAYEYAIQLNDSCHSC